MDLYPGSGNALAVNLLGPKDMDNVALASLLVLKGKLTSLFLQAIIELWSGRAMPLDVMSVTQGKKHYYSFLSQSFGLMAEIDVSL